MTIRLMCDARGKFREDFMNKIIELGDGDVELAVHIGYENADFHGPSLQWMNHKIGQCGPIVGSKVYSDLNLNLIAQQDFKQIMETTVEQLYRTSPDYSYKSHNIRHLHDYIDYFHIAVDAAAQIIVDKKVTHALFFCIPHLFYDMVFYEVAKALGVKTTILTWSHFDGRFFSMSDIKKMGSFNTSAIEASPYPIEKGSVPELFFMDDRWQNKSSPGKITKGAVLNLFRHLIKTDPLKLLNPVHTLSELRKISKIYNSLPDWRDPFAKFFHTNELAYFKHLSGFESGEVDLSCKYIYVPLHNQPEMTTSSLGGKFRDQALLLECLARDLPADWKIYVKENPRQGAYARGPMFFHRLKRIPQLQVLPSNANTHALSRNAQFVASVNGTVGWEAIRQGRPAMVFGSAWYGSFEGVVQYEPGIDYQKLSEYVINHEKLEQDAGALFARSHEGVVEQLFFPLKPDLDHSKNINNVAFTSLKILREEMEPTFA